MLRGNATTGAGLVDRAFILDGDGDYVEVPHDPALNFGANDFTVDLWVYFNNTDGEQSSDREVASSAFLRAHFRAQEVGR